MSEELTLNEYQGFAETTAVFPEYYAEEYLMLGLASEVGEMLGKLAKYYRKDGDGGYPDDALIDELGDVLWFVAMLATFLEQDLSEVARKNITKLQDRKARGVIKGSGDNR